MYANTCSEWIKAMGTIINAQIVYSKCMPTVITAPLCMKFLIDLAAPCCVCPTLHSPILAIIVLFIIILRQSTMTASFFQGDDDMHDNDDSPTSNVVDNDSNCLHNTSDSNKSFSFLKGTSTHGDSKVFFNGLN